MRAILLWAPGLFLVLLTGMRLGGRDREKKIMVLDNKESEVPSAHNKLLYSRSYTNWTTLGFFFTSDYYQLAVKRN